MTTEFQDQDLPHPVIVQSVHDKLKWLLSGLVTMAHHTPYNHFVELMYDNDDTQLAVAELSFARLKHDPITWLDDMGPRKRNKLISVCVRIGENEACARHRDQEAKDPRQDLHSAVLPHRPAMSREDGPQ